METPDSIKKHKVYIQVYPLIFAVIGTAITISWLDNRYIIDPLNHEVEQLNSETEKLKYDNARQSDELTTFPGTTQSLKEKHALQPPPVTQDCSPPTHSKPVEPPLTASNADVFIPSDVESMWVFLQKGALSSNPVCERLADPISPREFKKNINKYFTLAKDKDMSLIITAFSRARGWTVVDQIRIGNRPTNVMAPYTCNEGRVNYGVEITHE